MSAAYSEAYFVHSYGKDPTSWAEAMAGPFANEWIAAMLEERESFRARNVYKLVPRAAAKGYKIFKPKPVFKIKLNPPNAEEPNGSLDKFKYRLVIMAFTRMLKQGIDYEEKRSSQARWESLKAIIGLAVHLDFDLVLNDIKTFFFFRRVQQKYESFYGTARWLGHARKACG